MTTTTGPSPSAPSWPEVGRRTARVALIFSALVLALMVVNAVGSRSANPIEAASLEGLRHDLRLRPNDEALRQRVRREDVRIRREYFRHRDFAVRGAWLLLLGIVTFLAASEMAKRAGLQAPSPQPDAATRARAAGEATYRALVGVGGLLGGALLTLVVLARHDTLSEYSRHAASAPVVRATDAPGQAGPRTGASAAPAGLPVAGGTVGQGGVSAIPTPEGGALAGPGTVLAPVATRTTSSAPLGQRPTTLNRPLPVLAASVAPGWESNWPRFRGPQGTGHAPGSTPPAQWNGPKGEGVLWKTAIPLPGWNSPIVWGDRVLVCGADEAKREVYALDLNTGAIVWRTPIPIPAGVKVPKVQPDTGYAPATMATDGARICASFVGGDVACLDMKGKLLWTRGFGSLDNPYGHASSPVIFGSGVLLQLDQGTSADDGKSLLMALDLVSGKTVWQIKRPVGGSWSTPLVINVDGKEQAITTANPWVIAYDPHNGQELWRADCLGGEVAVSAVFGQGYVLVANQGSNSAAIRPDGRGDVTKSAVAWTAGDGLPDIVSPVVWDDLMLLVTTDGFLTCVDIKTGKRVWEGDLEKTIRASPVLAGGRLYLLDAEGVTHVLQPGREFKVLGKFPLGEAANATPAFVGKRIVFRGKQHVFCVGAR